MYKKIADIIKVTEAIKTLYDRLCNLEINNLKETKEYHKNLDYLMISLEMEESFYMNIDRNSIVAMKDVIISCLNNNAIIKERMLSQLDFYKMNFECNKMTKAQELFRINSKVFISRILTILQESIDSEIESDLRIELVKIKYSLLYKNPENEKDLILDAFNIKNEFREEIPMTNNSVINDDNKIDNSGDEALSFLETLNIIRTAILKDDAYYSTLNGKVELISLQCSIRARLLSLNEELIGELNEMFNIIVKEKNDSLFASNGQIVEEAITECFKKASEDKTKQYVIRIKK